MPVYEYECDRCCFRFELSKRVGEDIEVYCPRCHGQSHRVFSAVPVIFKGSRWVGERKPKRDKAETRPDSKAGKTQKKKATE
jgi:putative FmdB family regulatory protein